MIDLLRRVAAGELTPEAAAARLRGEAVLRLGDEVALDLARERRTGIPEVVLAGPKRPADVARIVDGLLDRSGTACVSRMRAGHRRAVETTAAARGAEVIGYGRRSCRVVMPGIGAPPRRGLVGLLSGGTADAEPLAEARMVCDAAGCATALGGDVGVAGLHRLLGPLAELIAAEAAVLVVAAGMDGALASVVAGLSPVPVIGLPVSTGYGMGGNGEAALLSMLQGCAPGLVVVNVDNGVGAGAAAALIAAGRTPAAVAEPAEAHDAGRPTTR